MSSTRSCSVSTPETTISSYFWRLIRKSGAGIHSDKFGDSIGRVGVIKDIVAALPDGFGSSVSIRSSNSNVKMAHRNTEARGEVHTISGLHGGRASRSLGRSVRSADLAPEFLTVDADIRRRGNTELYRIRVNRDHGDRQLSVRHQNPFAKLTTEDEHGKFLLGLALIAYCVVCCVTASLASK
jgi:hypothetical protein